MVPPMPIIAYQSFNANSSSTHGLASISNQRFTRDTNAYVTGRGHQALVLPYDAGALDSPIEGPANLVPIQLLATPHTVHAFGAQVSLAFQNFNRIIEGMPDIMVIGELDTSHPDFTGLFGGAHISVTAHPAKKACQSFTAIANSEVAAYINFRSSGEGYVIYSVGVLNVVFVHVPNRVASSRAATEDFYLGIAHSVGVQGKIIDLIIGDTNQPSFNYSEKILNSVFHTDSYVNASSKPGIVKADNWGVEEKGTNSVGTEMYDIAVFRSDINVLKNGPAYISQSSGAVTVTDHCGLVVQIERKSEG